MKLSRVNLKNISSEKVSIPDEGIFNLPEKVLQFGTGRLLRGLPDYFLDKANQMGIFKGRIVVVKTTSKGDVSAFDTQTNLYTLCERGVDHGKKIEKNTINSSISRLLIAQNDWKEILECARNKNLKIIISNTTEIGIQLVNEDIKNHPPASFPGKVLAFLHERFIAFKGSAGSGFVIVPTELIPDNGKKLKSIILELARLNNLEEQFMEWIESDNYFCNSLVDRIVTGMPDKETRDKIEKELGYSDALLVVSELYSLWAIEGDDTIKNILSFAKADEGVIIEPNIDLHRELKLRLLNGTHTLFCGIAFLAGYDTVYDTMQDKLTSSLVAGIMRNEIAPFIPYEIAPDIKEAFISKVLDRFLNPYIKHYWENITLNYSSKLRLRCIPILMNHYKKNETVPHLFALGFASYLYFMKAMKQKGNEFFGKFKDRDYLIQDEQAAKFYVLWKEKSPEEIVQEILGDISLWGYDLLQLKGFGQEVTHHLLSIMKNGMKTALENVSEKIMNKT